LVAQVLGAELEDVEDVERDPLRAGAVTGPVDPGSQQFEIRPSVGRHDDHFAVQNDVAERGETGQLREPVGPLGASARPQPGPRGRHLGEAAVPVQPALVRLAVRRRGRRYCGRQHGPEGSRHVAHQCRRSWPQSPTRSGPIPGTTRAQAAFNRLTPWAETALGTKSDAGPGCTSRDWRPSANEGLTPGGCERMF